MDGWMDGWMDGDGTCVWACNGALTARCTRCSNGYFNGSHSPLYALFSETLAGVEVRAGAGVCGCVRVVRVRRLSSGSLTLSSNCRPSAPTASSAPSWLSTTAAWTRTRWPTSSTVREPLERAVRPDMGRANLAPVTASACCANGGLSNGALTAL